MNIPVFQVNLSLVSRLAGLDPVDDERPKSCTKCGAVMWVQKDGLKIDGGEKNCFHQWQLGDLG